MNRHPRISWASTLTEPTLGAVSPAIGRMGVPMLTEYEAYVLSKERSIGRASPPYRRRRVAPADVGVILVLSVALMTVGSLARLQRVHTGVSWEAQEVSASFAKRAEGEASHD